MEGCGTATSGLYHRIDDVLGPPNVKRSTIAPIFQKLALGSKVTSVRASTF